MDVASDHCPGGGVKGEGCLLKFLNIEGALDAIWCYIFCKFKKNCCRFMTCFAEGTNKGILS